MKWVRRLVNRLTSWVRIAQDEERLRAEIEEHLAFQVEANLRAGLSPAEAHRQALLKFGPMEAIKEDCRDLRGSPWIETLGRDIRYSLRRMRKAPAFTSTVVLTLALGIGATASIFTLVHAVLLKPLAVAKPSELYRVGTVARCCYWGGYTQKNEYSLFSYELYKHLRDNTHGFAELAAFQASGSLFGVRRTGRANAAEGYPGEYVSGNYFAMFGIGAYAGRLLDADDDRPGAPPVAVRSYRLWQQRFGSDPSVVGGTFSIDEHPFTVVGITPPAFFGGQLKSSPPDFFLPLNTEPYVETDSELNHADTSWLDLIGRASPGVVPASIEADMRVELQQWLRSHWNDMTANDRLVVPN